MPAFFYHLFLPVKVQDKKKTKQITCKNKRLMLLKGSIKNEQQLLNVLEIFINELS